MVYLDATGQKREDTKIDNLYDQDNLDEFIDLLRRRDPGVIVIGGFSMATLKLIQRVKEILQGKHTEQNWAQTFNIPVIYINDDVARIYQHSQRAASEYGGLSSVTKYCVGLARYVQSPLNEFVALGSDITAITFEEDDQHLVPVEKLLIVFERVLVDITNKVGVDINRTVTDSYYQHLLPFVCGLGPRKAQALIKKISALVCSSICLFQHLLTCVGGGDSCQSRSIHQRRFTHYQNFPQCFCVLANRSRRQ